MAPILFRRQLEHGAWAMTAATTWQAAAMRAARVERVLIANEVVVPAEVEWLAAAVADGFEVYCYVDSLDGLAIMTSTLAAMGADTHLPVLLEVGVPGHRTGARGVADAVELAEAIAASGSVALTGVAGFEGTIVDTADRKAVEIVDEFLDTIVEVTHLIAAKDWFAPSPEVIVSAGGSAFFDRVVNRFAGRHRHTDTDRAAQRVLSHPRRRCLRDVVTARRRRPHGRGRSIRPAIEIWGAVLSRPEPTRALVGVGKRDVSYDGLLPQAKKVRRRGSSTVESFGPLRVRALNDQHAYLDLEASDRLAVGDLVGFGISHPCTTFDKWRSMLLVDDDYNVTDRVDTQF